MAEKQLSQEEVAPARFSIHLLLAKVHVSGFVRLVPLGSTHRQVTAGPANHVQALSADGEPFGVH